MQLERINLSLNPSDYIAVVYKHRDGVDALKKLIPTSHEIDEEGNPQALSLPGSKQEKENQKAINRLVYSIYSINGATQILLQERRDDLNIELSKFRDLGANERIRELIKEKSISTNTRNSEKIKPKEQNVSDNSSSMEEIIIGEDLKHLTPEKERKRYESHEYMSEKRRAYVRASKITPEIPMLGLAGILMSGPSVYIPFFTANDIGLKSKSKQARLATLSLFEGQILSTLTQYDFEANKIKTDFLSYKQDEYIPNLLLIINAISNQKNYGTDDTDPDVREKANNIEAFAYKACNLIKKSQKLTDILVGD